MESRPDLAPPCCAACVKAGDVSVTWQPDDTGRPGDLLTGWWARHGTTIQAIAHGAEAREVLRALHYELLPEVKGPDGKTLIPAGVSRENPHG